MIAGDSSPVSYHPEHWRLPNYSLLLCIYGALRLASLPLILKIFLQSFTILGRLILFYSSIFLSRVFTVISERVQFVFFRSLIYLLSLKFILMLFFE